MFTHGSSPFVIIKSSSTINTELGFEPGEVDLIAFIGVQGSTLYTTVQKTISIVAGVRDSLSVKFFNQTNPTGVTLSPAGFAIPMATFVASLTANFTAAGLAITATYDAQT